MKKLKTLLYSLVLAAGLLGMVPIANAQLMIMPTRINFNDGERVQAIAIINTGVSQGIYRVDFVNTKQNDIGAYAQLGPDQAPQYDLAKMLVYSPRQISLDPQGKQAVRLSLRRPADLPDGEYRTHIRLSRLSQHQTDQDSGVEDKAAAAVGISVGFIVPVTLRKGAYDTTAKIQSVKYVPGVKPAAEIEIARQGKFSSTGNVQVFWTPAGGQERLVGTQNGVAIYPEVPLRKLSIPLDDKTISGGQLRVVYKGIDMDESRLYDDKAFAI